MSMSMSMSMNLSVKNELSNLGLLGAVGLLAIGQRQRALQLGLVSLGLRLVPNPRFSYEGSSVVITGGSRGLGLALAESLSARGAKITLLARDEEELGRAKKQLESNSTSMAEVLTIACDVTNRSQLKSAFEQIQNRFGRIDLLINNAGSVSAGPFQSMNQKDFEAQMNLHFFAVLKSIQVVLPFFHRQGGGRIANISSIGGKIPVPHMSAYCASKFALSGFSETLSAELKKDNVHVTTIYPGLMRTGSPIQGVFKGDSEKEFAWFAISDSMPGLTVSAKTAAQKILKSIQNGESEVIISWPAKFGTFAHSNFPRAFIALMSVVNRFLPKGTSDERRTGAQSQTWLRQRNWSKPFLGILGRAQMKYNEHEKFDPEFNLNVAKDMTSEA